MMNDTGEIVGPGAIVTRLLGEFAARVPVWSVTAFTVDGYVVGNKLSEDRIPETVAPVISSMSAGLITIAEDFIRLVDGAKVFGQILVDSRDAQGGLAFSIILRHVAQNLLLSCIFPHSTPLGLVTFEIETLCQELSEAVRGWDTKLHEQSLT
ncbi:MAG: hypothetical protein QXS20_09085 [Candidatus Thorarchaeota archaeon]